MVKDPIMKIKKKSKLNTKFHDGISEKEIIHSRDEVVSTEIRYSENDSEQQAQKRKKKKAKQNYENSEQSLKRQKTIGQTIFPKVKQPKYLDSLQVSQKADTTIEKKEKIAGIGSEVKDTLMTRLRNASTHINSALSLLHIPKHKKQANDGDDDDDGGKLE